jgi:hypothetical protein
MSTTLTTVVPVTPIVSPSGGGNFWQTPIPLGGGFAVDYFEIAIILGCGLVGYMVSKKPIGLLLGAAAPVALFMFTIGRYSD